MMSRLFVFGCSFSAYCWPTWADTLSIAFDEYYNYGLSGLGNRAIAERIAEADQHYNFNSEDTIIVQWSTHIRHDWFNPVGKTNDTRLPGWKTYGSIFNYHNRELFTPDWLDTFFHEPSYFYHTLNYISLIQRFLDGTGAEWYMTSIGDIRNKGTDLQLTPSNYAEAPTHYEETNDFIAWDESPSLKSYEDNLWNKNKDRWIEPIFPSTIKEVEDFITLLHPEDGDYIDGHPTTIQYNNWLVDYFLPKTDIKISNEHINKLNDKFIELYKESNKVFFVLEKLLYNEKWNGLLKKWPNKPLGYYQV